VTNRLVKAAMTPLIAVKFGLELIALRGIGINPIVAFSFILELYSQQGFWDYIHNTLDRVKNSYQDPRLGGWMLGYPAIVLYSLVRMMKPKTVIETGVGPGGSTALILLGLWKNEDGHLYSIDLPGNDALVYPKIGRCYNVHVPPGYNVGWLVPPWLKGRWSLELGDSKELLPELISRLGSADMFLHDSLHTDEHVLFELSTVFPYLAKNGLLLADDVNEYWSTAFVKFCEKKGLPFIVLGNRLGIARRAQWVRE
jgi:hypothetical protein